MNKNIYKYAGLNAAGTALYIAVVAWFLTYLSQAYGSTTIMRSNPWLNPLLIPIAMLLLFVFSASFTGMLVLGRPVFWYMEGKKKDAVSLLLMTIGFLFIITLAVFLLVLATPVTPTRLD